MLLRYSFPNFLAGQDVTKITRDLNCKYMEVPSKLTPSLPNLADLGQESSARKNGGRKDIDEGPPRQYHLAIEGVKRAFDDTCDSPLPNIGPIRSKPASEGKWILARARNRIKRNPADRNDFGRIESTAGNLRCSSFVAWPDDLHRASVFGQCNG